MMKHEIFPAAVRRYDRAGSPRGVRRFYVTRNNHSEKVKHKYMKIDKALCRGAVPR